jgi:hypothetical protein
MDRPSCPAAFAEPRRISPANPPATCRPPSGSERIRRGGLRKVRLRGLGGPAVRGAPHHLCVRNRCAADGSGAVVALRARRPQFAKADPAISQRRIHSLLVRTRRPGRPRSPTSPVRPQPVRGGRLRRCCRRAPRRRPQFAKADFATSQRRIHSLLVRARRGRTLHRGSPAASPPVTPAGRRCRARRPGTRRCRTSPGRSWPARRSRESSSRPPRPAPRPSPRRTRPGPPAAALP